MGVLPRKPRPRGDDELIRSGFFSYEPARFEPLIESHCCRASSSPATAIRSWSWQTTMRTAAAGKRSMPPTATGRGGPRMALCNIARTGYFSADRSVREYAEQIWGVRRFRVDP